MVPVLFKINCKGAKLGFEIDHLEDQMVECMSVSGLSNLSPPPPQPTTPKKKKEKEKMKKKPIGPPLEA